MTHGEKGEARSLLSSLGRTTGCGQAAVVYIDPQHHGRGYVASARLSYRRWQLGCEVGALAQP